MNPANKNTEQTIKDKLLQHDFEVDAGMWGDMEQKLDQGQNNKGSNGLWAGFRKGWYLLFLLLFLLSAMFIWQRSPNSEKLPTDQVNQVETNSKMSSQLKSPLADEDLFALDDSKNAKANAPATKEVEIENNGANEEIKNSNSLNHSPENEILRKNTNKHLETAGSVTSTTENKEYNSFKTDQNGTSTNPGVKEIGLGTIADTSLLESTVIDYTANNPTLINKDSLASESSLASNEAKISLGILHSPIPLLEKQKRDDSETLKKWWRSLPKSVTKPSFWYFEAQAGISFPGIKGINPLRSGKEIAWHNRPSYFLQLAIAYQLNERISLATGLNYSKIPYRFDLTYTDIDGNRMADKTEQNIKHLSVPLIANFHLENGLSLSAGLGNTFRWVDSPAEKLFGIEEVDKLYKVASNLYKPSLSFWQAGIGFKLERWGMKASYQRYFGSTVKDFDVEEQRFETDTKEWNLNLALVYSIRPKTNISLTKTRAGKKLNRLFWGAGFALGRNYYSGSNSIRDLNLLIEDQFSTYKINALAYFQLKNRFRLQTELWYHHSKLSFEVDPALDSDPFNASDVLKINSLEIPLTLHFNPAKNFRLLGGLGLQFNFLNGFESITYPANPDFAAFHNSVPESFQKTLPFYDLGIGMDWKQFSIELRSRSMIGNFVDGVVYDEVSYNFTSRTYQWFVGINYVLGRE